MQAAPSQDRVSGSFLVASAVITTVALTHHPSVSARAPADLVKALVTVGPTNAVFHAFVIVMIGLLYLGLVGFARRRGLQSVFVLGGLVGATCGLAAEVGAALIDGFFVPGFGAHLARGNPAAIAQGIQVIAAAALVLQILAQFGLFAVAAAIVLWSVDLFDRDRAHVALAILGCVAGAVALIVSSTVATTLTSHNVAFVFAIQAFWYAVAGVLMILGRL
jgi:hypothetical protein